MNEKLDNKETSKNEWLNNHIKLMISMKQKSSNSKNYDNGNDSRN